MAYNSKGAIDINTAYDLPVYIRRYYIKLITEIIEKQNKEIEEVNRKSQVQTGGKQIITGPAVKPQT